MEVPTQRFFEVTQANRLIRVDALERLDIAYNPLIAAQNRNKIASAAAAAAALNSSSLNGANGGNGNGGGGGGCASGTPSSSKKTNGGSRMSLPAKVELPKVNVQIMSNYPTGIDDWELPLNKIKFVDKNYDELDDEVEYDMDEEDMLWLKLTNEKRAMQDPSAQLVTQDQFELLMDRLEKESYFQQSSAAVVSSAAAAAAAAGAVTNQSKSLNDSSSEDALCCICLDGECLNSNAILFCDMCNLAVHQECYGVPYIPEGQWLCRRCIQSPSTPVNCILCPNRYGAFKQTDDGLWAHVVCAIWIPEVHFANTVFLEPIIGIENIDKARWKLMCYICRKRNVGACIQCDKSNCYTAFHVTCAQQAGLYMNIQEEMVDVLGPPPASSSSSSASNRKKKKNHQVAVAHAHNTSTSSQPEVRRCAYCDIHTPLDVLSPKTRRAICSSSSNGGTASGGHQVNNTAECEEALKRAQKMRMKKARKILAERRDAPPVVSMPVLPKEKVQDIMGRVQISNIHAFFPSLQNYWLMKRFSRNGVPLLRRLQQTPGLKKNVEPKHNSSHLSNNNSHNDKDKDSGETVDSVREEEDAHERFRQQLSENLSYCFKIRQDLEKVRLLLELVRKRERLKRDQVRIDEIMTKYEINRLNGVFLQRLLEQLRTLDKNKVFFLPVNPDHAPNYYEEITQPMDFSKMQKKISQLEYHTLDEFEEDLKLMIKNCKVYNGNKSTYYRVANKLAEQAAPLLKQARAIYDKLDLGSEFAQDVAADEDDKKEAAADTTIVNQEPSAPETEAPAAPPVETVAQAEAQPEGETPMDTSVPLAEKTTEQPMNEETTAGEETPAAVEAAVTRSTKSTRRRASLASSRQSNAGTGDEATANEDAASSTPSTTSKTSTRRRASIAPAQVNTRGKRLSSISSASSLVTNQAVNDSTPSTSVPSPSSSVAH